MNIDIPNLLRLLEVDETENKQGGKVVQGKCETAPELANAISAGGLKPQGSLAIYKIVADIKGYRSPRRPAAVEIYRLSEKILRPPVLTKAEYLRGYVAVDLALGTLGIPFSKARLLKAANAKDTVYNVVFKRIKTSLGARAAPMGGNIAQLAVKYSGTSAERANAVLHKFQDACCATVPAEHVDRLVEQYNTPAYQAAAFCVACVQDKFKLDRKAVADAVKMQPKDLDQICAGMVTKCGLASVAHVAKAFRVQSPGSADTGRGAGAREGGSVRAKGKGKRPSSSRQDGSEQHGPQSEGDDAAESPAAATTTRLDGLEGADGSPGRPDQPGRQVGGAEEQLNFSEPMGRPSAPSQAQDPTASLEIFVKRLRTLESQSYTDWCLKTLGAERGKEVAELPE